MQVSQDRIFTKVWVVSTLTLAKGKTLGELDSQQGAAHLFDKVKPGNKGIAGDVIEQSVFKYKKDSVQQADILVDEVLTELKTTGVRIPKELTKEATLSEDNRALYFEAKEPVSITAVSVEHITEEKFLTSHFWEKTEHILFVLYEYASYKPVKAKEYADFRLVGFVFNKFNDEDKERLERDWTAVQSYIRSAQADYKNNHSALISQYKKLTSLRQNLRLVDLAPRFTDKTKPRFRLKQSFVTTLLKDYFKNSIVSQEEVITLDNPILDYEQIDDKCHDIGCKYSGKTLSQISSILGGNLDLEMKNSILSG